MNRSVGRMQRFPRSRMTGGTVTAARGDARLQVRNRGMAEAAVAAMDYRNCKIRTAARIMTVRTGGRT